MARWQSSLFQNHQEANALSVIAMIEDVLVELGHYVDNCRIDSPEARNAWRIHKGSAEAVIALIDRDGATHLRAVAAVMTVDDRVDTRALYRRILDLNANEVVGAAFALRDNHVILVSERPIVDLDRSEVLDIFTRVQEYADHWDDKLVEEFGGVLGAPD